MKKILIIILLMTQGLLAIKCDDPKQKVCIKIRKEPLYTRAYVINMSNHDVKLTASFIDNEFNGTSFQDRIFKKATKTKVHQIENKYSQVHKKRIQSNISTLFFKFKIIEEPKKTTSYTSKNIHGKNDNIKIEFK